MRVGILTGLGRRFENWELQLFERLLADQRFEMAGFLVHPHPFDGQPSGLAAGWIARLDRALFARQAPYPAPRFARSRKALPVLHLDGASQPVAELGLDLVLRHVPARPPHDLVAGLPFGVWTLSHVEAQSAHANWTGIADTLAKAAGTRLGLTVERGDGKRAVQIAEAAFNTKFSAARNTAFIQEKSVLLAMRELGRLADTRKLAAPAAKAQSARPATPPSLREAAAYAGHLLHGSTMLAAKVLRRRTHSEAAVWTLYSGRGAIDDFDPRKAVEIPPSQTSIKADPFLFRHQGETYVFYENYGVGDSKAHIAVGRLTRDRLEPIGIALGGDSHLSFPFVFSHDGAIFMMPETHQKKRVEIWRAVNFPLVWEPYSSAFEGWSVADSTLFRHKGAWWLFSNLSEHHAFEDHCSALYAFEVDGPKLSSIVAHRRNPVVIGSATARNAGRVFSRHKRLFRPSQNNAYGIYGYGLNIMEIEQLDRETYRETCVRRIVPDFKPGLVGCHHFDASGSRYILDARLNA
ncbi:hypothetical protein NA2_12403 [Nitratireductor pacificus pht-3B]|uniref:Glucosamine inositolphosphorylceramide transferase 1 N-terminal domain-containing protein n=1 Tax=Nitratireductor pacificus pht-3B TaxID=391937 RepID=K2M8D7_9HYPH|nr:hypothetical protein NA2_12403 [Nitratireductor pacificus pht-3B]